MDFGGRNLLGGMVRLTAVGLVDNRTCEAGAAGYRVDSDTDWSYSVNEARATTRGFQTESVPARLPGRLQSQGVLP